MKEKGTGGGGGVDEMKVEQRMREGVKGKNAEMRRGGAGGGGERWRVSG